MRAFFETLNHFKDLLTLLLASIGGGFALWRWMVEQKWRRVQHAQPLIKAFLERPSTIKAFEIIDTVGDVEFSVQNTRKREVINITDQFLIGALSTFEQKEENSEEELIIRDILDDFFGDLSTFQSHIETGLIKLQDIRPYLEYWIRELTGHGRLREHPFAAQTAKYLSYFGYDRILTLASNMGSPFPPMRMTRDEIIAKLRETAPALRAEGVTRLAIFGSRARGDGRADSDLDVLIEVDPAAKLEGLALIGVLADVERTIKAATGIATQAEMLRSLEPRFAERIADDLIEVF